VPKLNRYSRKSGIGLVMTPREADVSAKQLAEISSELLEATLGSIVLPEPSRGPDYFKQFEPQLETAPKAFEAAFRKAVKAWVKAEQQRNINAERHEASSS
jgi:hypothetical protein